MPFNTVPIHGKVARIEKGDVLISFTEGYEIEFETDFDDSTYQGDNWEDQLAGVSRFRGRMSGAFVAGNTEQKALFDNIVTAQPGTKITDLQFNLDALTNAFTGDIHITSLAVPANKGGKVVWTINFKGSGQPALSDAA